MQNALWKFLFTPKRLKNVVPRRSSTLNCRYTKNEIASNQLKTASLLFLNNRDMGSVITLAGAAGNILSQLVRNAGGEPFADYSRRYVRDTHGSEPSRQKYGRHIADTLGINALKHMSPGEPDDIQLDLDKCAADALLKAVTDYVQINGQEELFVKAVLRWAWENRDGAKIMEEFNSLPNRLKP